MTVGDLLDRLSFQELRLWNAYLAREPDSGTRVEIALAGLTAQYVNKNRGKGKKASKVSDFLPFANPWKSSDVPEDVAALREAFASRLIIKKREDGQ